MLNKSKSKFYLMLALLGSVVFGMAVFGYLAAAQNDYRAMGFVLPAVAIVIAANVVFLIRRSGTLKRNEPFEDERDLRIKNRAGALSFYGSLYWLLALLWYNSLIVDMFEAPALSAEDVITASIIGMAMLFMVTYIYVYKRNKNI